MGMMGTVQARTEEELAKDIKKISKKLSLDEAQQGQVAKLYTEANEKIAALVAQPATGAGMPGAPGMAGAAGAGTRPNMGQATGPQAGAGAAGAGARPNMGQATGPQTGAGARPGMGQAAGPQGGGGSNSENVTLFRREDPSARPQAGAGAGARMQFGGGFRNPGAAREKEKIENERNEAVKALLNEKQTKKFERFLKLEAARAASRNSGGFGGGMGGF